MENSKIRIKKVFPVTSEIFQKYAGKHIVLFQSKVVGWGDTVKEAYQMARKALPDKKSHEFLLRFIPKEGMLIL